MKETKPLDGSSYSSNRPEQDKIYIIGAGAIGKVLATFLILEGKNVVLLRGSIDDNSDHVEKIEVEVNDLITVSAMVRISTLSCYSSLDGIVVLTNKSFGNPDLAQALGKRIGHSPLVILQNGLNIEQPFIDKGSSQIYRCVLFATSLPLDQNKFRFKPVAASPIGIINGNVTDLAMIVRNLSNTYFEFKTEQEIQPVIWTKTIVNCVFNSVCPLLETDNGIFYRNENALNIARRIIVECISVAKEKRILLEFDKVLDTLLRISRSSEGQLISTYQDIKNKRKTEIGSLNFAITNIAKQLDIGSSIKETRLLGELIRIKAEITQTDPN